MGQWGWSWQPSHGSRRVAGATATHIDVRDAPGNPAEKAVGSPREMAISHQERHRLIVMKSMGIYGLIGHAMVEFGLCRTLP